MQINIIDCIRVESVNVKTSNVLFSKRLLVLHWGGLRGKGEKVKVRVLSLDP